MPNMNRSAKAASPILAWLNGESGSNEQRLLFESKAPPSLVEETLQALKRPDKPKRGS
jgi:hypothetical protein